MKAKGKVITDEDKQFKRVVEKWLCSFSKNIETEEEETFGVETFEHFLSHQSQVSEALKLFTQEHWEKVRCGYLDIWIFGCLDVWALASFFNASLS